MDTIRLLQSITTEWLASPTLGELSAVDAESLVGAANRTISALWPLVDVFYRTRSFKFTFQPDGQGAAMVTQFSAQVNFFSQPSSWGEMCSVRLGGENTRFRMEYASDPDGQSVSLLDWDYTGDPGDSGQVSARYFHDAVKFPAGISSVLCVRDENSPWEQVPSIDNLNVHNRCFFDVFSRVHRGTGQEECFLRIRRLHSGAHRLTVDAIWRPLALGILDTIQSKPLPYPDWFSEIVIDAAGAALKSHPRFNSAKAAMSDEKLASASGRIGLIHAPRPIFNSIGTQYGW